MSRTNFRLNPLEARRLLLVAESELNRVQLQEELGKAAVKLKALLHQGKTLGAFASTTTAAMMAWSALRSAFRSGGERSKRSWFSKVIGAARFGASLWLASRRQAR